MTARANETFPGRVNDALRQLQATLLGTIETPAIARELIRDALDMARALREDVVAPEIARTPTTDKPVGFAMRVDEAETHAALCSAASRGRVIAGPTETRPAELFTPTETQREVLLILSLRLRSQIDQHAGRASASAPPPAPPTPPSPAEASL